MWIRAASAGITYARFSWHDAGHVSLAISPRRRRRRRRIAGSAAADAEVGQDLPGATAAVTAEPVPASSPHNTKPLAGTGLGYPSPILLPR
jgi:hypothetical protein